MCFVIFVAVFGRFRLENETSAAKYRQKCPKIADFWPEIDHFWVIFELFWGDSQPQSTCQPHWAEKWQKVDSG